MKNKTNYMYIQQVRERLTKRIMDFSRGHNKIVLEMGTGSGKTFNALSLVRLLAPSGKGLVLVPEIALINNFITDAKKHKFDDVISRAEVVCYASLKNYCDQEYSFIIYDECHHIGSEVRSKMFFSMKAKVEVMLSATISEEINDVIVASNRGFKFFEYPYEEALKDGLLPECEIEIVEYHLDTFLRNIPYKFKTKTVMLTEFDWYTRQNDSIKYWSDRWDNGRNGEPKWVFNKLLQAGSVRKRFLAEVKTKKIKEIIDKLNPQERFIVFGGSTDQIHTLGGELAISSKNTPKKNKNILSNFNNLKTNAIFAKDMLKEGQNLVDTRTAIIAGLGNKRLDGVQIRGRVLRAKNPKMIIIAVPGTVDERFLENQYGIDLYEY